MKEKLYERKTDTRKLAKKESIIVKYLDSISSLGWVKKRKVLGESQKTGT